MATVIGKTSTRIDQLLAKLVTNLSVVNGNLVATYRDGTTLSVGGVGSTQSVMRLFYENGSYPVRPTTVLCIEWVGPIYPSELGTKDSWVSTA